MFITCFISVIYSIWLYPTGIQNYKITQIYKIILLFVKSLINSYIKLEDKPKYNLWMIEIAIQNLSNCHTEIVIGI